MLGRGWGNRKQNNENKNKTLKRVKTLNNPMNNNENQKKIIFIRLSV